MRSFIVTLAAVAALAVAGPAFATGGPPNLCERNPSLPQCSGGGDGGSGGSTTNNNDNSARATSDASSRSSSDAFGLGVGVGIGGDSSARATGGDARATGGDSRSQSGFNAGHGSFSPDATAFSGVDFEDARFGNSRNTVSGEQQQGQHQGQQQGQIQGQLNAQGQETDQSNAQDTNVDIDASDRSTTIVEDRKDPVASAAPVFASACSAGISAQSYGFGGALANTNPMCDLALGVELAIKVDNFELANELVNRAATFAKHRTNPVRMYGQWIPFLGQLF